MTAVVPESAELADLAALDFAAPVLCDVDECHHDKINAQLATAVLARTMVCCVQTAPICPDHIEHVQRLRAEHTGIFCFQHRVIMCAHDALRIEPLP